MTARAPRAVRDHCSFLLTERTVVSAPLSVLDHDPVFDLGDAWRRLALRRARPANAPSRPGPPCRTKRFRSSGDATHRTVAASVGRLDRQPNTLPVGSRSTLDVGDGHSYHRTGHADEGDDQGGTGQPAAARVAHDAAVGGDAVEEPDQRDSDD